MRIKETFYAEVKEERDEEMEEELEEEMDPEEDCAEQAQPDTGLAEWVYKGIWTRRRIDKTERMAKGLCMTLEEYETIEQNLLNLAEIIGMDIESDIQRGEGVIRLVVDHFDLHRSENPGQMDALAEAVRRADYLYTGLTERYGEKLIQLCLHYDLNMM